MIVLCLLLIFIILKKCRKFKSGIEKKLISAIVILLFFMHPNIVQYTFYVFRCYDIEDEMRIINDLEVICWSE